MTDEPVLDGPIVIPVPAVDGLELRRLLPDDAERYHALVQHNRDHLTANGDYTDAVEVSVEDVRQEFALLGVRQPLRFGIWSDGVLVGRCDLVPVDPPRYGLGYWIAADHQGRGLAGASVRALVDAARLQLSATDVYAGVTHGNARSVDLLERSGFVAVERFDTYTRFHRALGRS